MNDKLDSKFTSLAIFYKVLNNKWYKPYVDGKPNIAKIEDQLTLSCFRGIDSFTQAEFDDSMKLVNLLLTEENDNGITKK